MIFVYNFFLTGIGIIGNNVGLVKSDGTLIYLSK
jgi:hypothetical protein